MDKIDQSLSQDGLLTRVFTSELDGKMYVDYQQDLEPHIEYATGIRNDPEAWRAGVKAGWVHAAHIPDVAIIKLRQIGVDILKGKPTAAEILAGLRKLGMDYLITTTQRV